MERNEIRINVRATAREKEELASVAARAGIKQSDIVRAAIRSTLNDIRRKLDRGQDVQLSLK